LPINPNLKQVNEKTFKHIKEKDISHSNCGSSDYKVYYPIQEFMKNQNDSKRLQEIKEVEETSPRRSSQKQSETSELQDESTKSELQENMNMYQNQGFQA
jgi:flagellar biosynthesis protein FliP